MCQREILLGCFVLFFPPSACFSLLVTLYCFLSFPVKATFVKLHPGHRVACVAFAVHSFFRLALWAVARPPPRTWSRPWGKGCGPQHQTTRYRYTGEEKAKRAAECHHVITLYNNKLIQSLNLQNVGLYLGQPRIVGY